MELLKKIIDMYKATPIEVKGGVLGAIIAIMFLWLGFLQMLFIIFCIVLGVVIAKILKGKKVVVMDFTRNLLERIFPSRWMR
jgi:uncharacterized membrane protein